jgi:hypothetical protein
MSYVVGSNNSYKPITNTAWVRAQLCKKKPCGKDNKGVGKMKRMKKEMK